MDNNDQQTFRDITNQLKFESSRDNILKDFYVPVLKRAKKYDRMAGFFSSSSLAIAVNGFSEFFIKSGQMRIICCAQIDQKDVESISEKNAQLSEIIDQFSSLSLKEIKDEIIQNRMKILCWLVKTGRLQIKIAFFKDTSGEIISPSQSKALQHSKVGVMEDAFGNKISFSGSVNESALGWGKNIEEFKVFRNWISIQSDYFKLDEKKFKEYWSGKVETIALIDIPEAVKENLIEFAPKDEMELHEEIAKLKGEVLRDKSSNSISGPSLSKELKLRDYQKEAIDKWISQNGKGVFKMATGTGKTKTALGSLVKLYEILDTAKKLPLVVIIVCPYQHLVRQWEEECLSFGFKPLLCFRGRSTWEEKLAKGRYEVNTGVTNFLSLIVTNSTFITAHFQSGISNIRKNILLICDEAHNLGAEKTRDKLPDKANFRLALSATFKRHLDEEGTEDLEKYFGDTCIDFGLKEAINSDCLCEYYYYPQLVELTNEENREYEDISRKIARLNKGREKLDFNNPQIKNLLFKRDRIIGKAENKYQKLDEMFSKIEDIKSVKNTLIFCGGGMVEDETDQSETGSHFIRQVDRITKLLGNKFHLKVRSYTAENSYESRKLITDSFKRKETQVVVAIRCLDEGVDIPSAECAYFLASNQNPKQFIQRRGRILRKDPQNPNKVAKIYDFIVIPSFMERYNDKTFFIERSLIKKELNRAMEFAKYARNAHASSDEFLDLQEKYHLMDMGV